MTNQLPWWSRMRGTPDTASCIEVARKLQQYLDGELNETAARRITHHLQFCRRCGLEAATYAEIKHAVGRRAAPVPPRAIERLQTFAQTLLRDGDSS